MTYNKYIMNDEAKKQIKNQLWSHHYRVQDVSKIPGTEYDLLVNDAYRVRVCGKQVKTAGCDVVALVSDGVKLYAKASSYARIGKDALTKKPSEVFGDV